MTTRALSTLILLAALTAASAADKFKPYTTKELKGGQEPQRVAVDISGLKELWLLGTSGNDDYHSDRAVWADPVLIDKDGNKVDLTTLKPKSAKVGYGKVLVNQALGGGPIKIGTKTFKKGFWVHAPSALQFQIDGKYVRFEASVGIGSGAGKKGSSEFRVLAKYDDLRMAKTAKGKKGKKAATSKPVKSKPIVVTVKALRMAIEDLINTFGSKYPNGQTYLKELSALESQPKGNARQTALRTLQQKALLANPLIDFEKLLVVRRSPKNLGMPSNWLSNSSLRRNGYDNDLAALPIKAKKKELQSIFRPAGGTFIGDVDLHFGAKKLLFSSVGKNGAWQVQEINIDGTGLREVTKTADKEVHNYDPCYLPDGRILFTSTAPYIGVPCINGKGHVANMFRCNADGSAMEQLCFDQEHEWCPQMMVDGRVLYLRWEYTDLPHSNSRIMMTMNPDGTNQRSYYGTNSFWPNGVFYARQIPGSPSMFCGIVTGHHGVKREGELVVFDTNKGYMEADGAVQHIPGYGKKVEPIVADRLVNDSWPKFLHPYPLSKKYYLTAMKPDPKSNWGIYLVDVFDNLTLIHEQKGYALLEPVPLKPTTPPPVIPDKVNKTRKDGTVFISDIYEGPGLAGIPRGEVKKLRLFTYTYGYHKGFGGLYGTIGVDGPWDLRRILGTVPIEADGSAMFKVPANIPISIQPLDKEGKAMQLMRSWFVVRPGEALSCVGCHEPSNLAPTVKITKAARKAPVGITPWRGPARNFEYAREVQPVIDKHCLGCHGSKQQPAGDKDGLLVNYKGKSIPNLRGDVMLKKWKRKHAGTGRYAGFSVGYFNLFRHTRQSGIESDIHLLKPMEFHADTDELIMMLQKGHHGVKLGSEGMDRIVTWLDLNRPYHGRWSTMRGAGGVESENRRAAMRKLYAGVDENHEQLPELTSAKIKPIMPNAQPKLNKQKLSIPGWPFDAATAKSKQTKQDRQVDLGNGVTMTFCYIPAGRFAMGSSRARDEYPATDVSIAQGYWIGKFEVTNKQFLAFDKSHDSGREDRHGYQFGVTCYPVTDPDMPAVRLSWKAAMAFCEWLSQKTGRQVTLPTEAQWEWACRAGTSTAMNYGDAETDFSKFGNMADITLAAFSGNPYVQDWRKAQYKNADNVYDNWIPQIGRVNDNGFISEPVGKYQANAWGLHDMHGNVAEWTRSLYKPYPYNDSDGRNNTTANGSRRVVRGGSWYDRPKYCTSSFRRAYRDYQKVYNVGFRVVIEK